MLVQLPYKTDADLLNIYSLWEAGILRCGDGYPWALPHECKTWLGYGDPTGKEFRDHANRAYIELEE